MPPRGAGPYGPRPSAAAALHGEPSAVVAQPLQSAGDPADLSTALELLRALHPEVPADHPEWAKWQADAAHVLHLLGIHTRDQRCLAEAARILHAATAAVGPVHRDAVMHLINLGGVLVSSVELDWHDGRYEEAVSTLDRALAATRPGQLSRAEALVNLGLAHAARHRADGSDPAYRTGVDAFGEVVQTATAPARLRAMAGQHLGNLHVAPASPRPRPMPTQRPWNYWIWWCGGG